MAQMPRGEPRSVPDPAGELYDEMNRQKRLKEQRAEAGAAKPRPSSDAPPFSSFRRRPDFRAPRLSPTVTIGGKAYREIDNGRANVLVPVDDPLNSPAELAERRRGIDRAFFMAASPVAGAAYGLASLTGASPQARDSALAAGGLIDAAILGAAPRGAPVRGQVAMPRQGQPVAPNLRPSIRYREPNASGQAAGVTATITSPMIGTGTKAYWRLTPPGWQGNGKLYNEARAHLFAKDLGGSGRDMRNLVTLTHKGANTPQMQSFEQGVAQRARAGEVVEYSATPLYGPGALPPAAVLLTAVGSRGAPTARVIQNPAGWRR
jgi:hypothetical protein